MTPPSSGPLVTTMQSGSITAMLAERVESEPTAVFLRSNCGDLTYAELHDKAATLAGSLHDIRVRPGTRVVLFMHNSLDQVIVWFALARLGAVHVPINTALLGPHLRHVLRVADPQVVVVDRNLRHVVHDGFDAAPSLQTVIVAGTDLPVCPDTTPPWRTLSLTDLIDGGRRAPAHRGSDLDPATMLFTSGTTGLSKACVLSHRYLARQGQIHAAQFRFRADDVLYCPFPLFHIDAATLTVVAALAVGATAAIGQRFSASGFWREVRAFDATVFNFMGATLSILWKRPPAAEDRAHRVRLAWGVPMPSWQDGWRERFGFPLFQVYGLTDAGVPVYDPVDGAQRRGTCGRVIDQFDVVIAPVAAERPDMDGADRNVGEILVRGREPGLTMTGYHGMAEATAATMDGDGWVHTGDLGSIDGDGYLTFHGRLSDSIRRRGENISAYEVEQLIDSHPAVLESSAIGLPSELTEEDIKVCVVLKPGSQLTAGQLHDYCREHAAAFMIPRYIEFMDALPKTPTEKVEKFRLRATGVTQATWDAEAQRAGTEC